MDTLQKALEMSRTQRSSRAPASAFVRPAIADGPGPAARALPVLPVDADLLRRNRVLLPMSSDVAAQSFKMLRTQVLQRMRQAGFRTLAIVSPATEDGKTTVAVNLAIAIAGDADSTALLVDMDLHRPSVHTRFGMKPDRGIEDCLRDRATLDDVLVQPAGFDRLAILPATAAVPQSSELLASERTGRFVKELAGHYPNGIVVIDLPPILATDDALAVLPQIDAVLVVAREGGTRRDQLLRCLEAIRDKPVVGTVLNGSREPAQGYL